MAVDFMGAMRRCARCKSSDDTVAWCEQDHCYMCDGCYEELYEDDE